MPRRKKPFTHEDVKAPEDLERLNQDELIEFLRSDREEKIELWNTWRTSLAGEIEYFETHSLFQVNLSDATLEGIDFAGMYLLDSRFDKADLTFSNLSKSNLSGSHLRSTYLMESNLTGAIMIGANLTTAFLNDSCLDGTNLSSACLAGAYIRNGGIRHANLTRADFRRATLFDAHFDESDLRGIQLAGAFLHGADFTGADLRYVDFRDVKLSDVVSLRNVRLYQALFRGILDLKHELFLDAQLNSTIWEETQGRFSEAKDVYRALKGYFEGAGDYEGANWAYEREQVMEKLVFAPRWVRWMYPRWKDRWVHQEQEFDPVAHDLKLVPKEYCRPHVFRWIGLELADNLAGYGLSLTKPLFWLAFVILTFALIYWLFGMITDIPGCQYPNPRTPGCHPGDFLDALVFSVSAMTTVDSGTVQPYLSNVSLTASVEALLGIALTGLFGFVLGNKLRSS